MKKTYSQPISKIMGVFATVAIAVTVLTSLYSFSVTRHYSDEFLRQLGITKATADSKLNSGFLSGSFDEMGLSKAKSIMQGNRAAIVKDVVNYAKKYVNSPAFIKEYNAMRSQAKPELQTMKTPEQMQQEMIESSRKGLADAEASLKKADASLKPVFEKIVAEGKKQVADAENPNNKSISNYRKNYDQGVKIMEQNNKQLIANWETQYPSNHLLYVKERLIQFLNETKDVDFDAELTERKGIKYFVNKSYESKGKRWKMAFRAGKEAIETARTLVEQWSSEIK